MPAPPADLPTSAAGVILERGQSIDRFVVLGLVGRGGMGEVYAAYDPELDRKIAIKLLRARGDAAEGRTRLLREAQAIAKLSHPNVVVVYDVGTVGDSVFIAMEFVDGRTLGGWMVAGVRSRREILSVFFAAARGLAAAHAAGLVHRDFKPDNVMVTNDGQVRVMDFGLARQAGAARDEPLPVTPTPPAGGPATLAPDTLDPAIDPDETLDHRKGGQARDLSTTSGKYLSLKLTQTGAMVGTPAYMAPEQFAMATTDARTDQFSFCVALYEALYGERPFPGDSFATLMTNVVTGAVRPAPAKTKTRVPGWIRRVLLRGLEAKAESRHASMNALLVALESDPTVRVRRAALGAGLLVALVGAGLGLRRAAGSHEAICRGGDERWASVWAANGAASPRKAAIHGAFVATKRSYAEQAFAGAASALDGYVGKWLTMYQETCEATRVRGEQSTEVLDLRMSCLKESFAKTRALVDVFSRADGQVVENAIAATASLARLDRCADVTLLKAVVPPPADEATRARVEALRGDEAKLVALREAGHCGEAEALAETLIPRVRAAGYLPLVADVLNAAGYLSDQCVDANLGVERYKEAFLAGLASRHDEAAATSAIIVGGFSIDRLGQLDAAKEWSKVARAMLQRFGNHPVLDAYFIAIEAQIDREEGRTDEAIARTHEMIAIRENLFGKDHFETFAALNTLANNLMAAGRNEEAAATFAKAVQGLSRALGPDHPLVAMAASNLGEALNALHRFGEAQPAFQRALDTWRGAGSSPFFISYGLTGKGIALLGQGHATDAIVPLEEALRIRANARVGPEIVDETRLALARALWSRPTERPRALTLAREVHADLHDAKTTTEKARRSQVVAWLAAPTSSL